MNVTVATPFAALVAIVGAAGMGEPFEYGGLGPPLMFVRAGLAADVPMAFVAVIVTDIG